MRSGRWHLLWKEKSGKPLRSYPVECGRPGSDSRRFEYLGDLLKMKMEPIGSILMCFFDNAGRTSANI
jgi:hypothetical protein